MESFTLWPTTKIDFTADQSHTGKARELADLQYLPKHPLYAVENSPPNYMLKACLKPLIYRLRKPKNVSKMESETRASGRVKFFLSGK